MPDFKFEGCHLPLRYPPHTCNDCPEADYSSPPHHMRSRNKRDNFTWLSEESCSSSAVRGEDIADMPSARCRRYAKDFQRPLMSNMKENYDEDMWNRMGSTMKGQEECNKSRKSARSKPHSKSAFFSPAIFSEDLVHDQDSWLLEEEFSLPNTTSSPGSFIKSSEKSQHRGEGLFGTDAQTELLGDSRCFLERSERDTPDEYSSENVAFSQPFCSRKSFNISKTSGQERWLGLQHDFGIHVQSSNSSEVADFFGEAESATTNPDLPAQGSVTKEEGDKPMSLPLVPENSAQISAGNKSLTPESRLPAGDTNLKGYSDPLPEHKNGVPDEMPAFSSEDMEEISSPRKILHESDGNFTSKKWQGSVPVLHQPKLKCTNIISVDDMVCFAGKDMDEENPNEPKAKTMSRESRSRESSCQMMMFQRCVQLLCVLKS